CRIQNVLQCLAAFLPRACIARGRQSHLSHAAAPVIEPSIAVAEVVAVASNIVAVEALAHHDIASEGAIRRIPAGPVIHRRTVDRLETPGGTPCQWAITVIAVIADSDSGHTDRHADDCGVCGRRPGESRAAEHHGAQCSLHDGVHVTSPCGSVRPPWPFVTQENWGVVLNPF